MRRAPIVLSATVVGLVGVLTFKPREPALKSFTASAATGVPSSSPAGSTPSAGSGSGSGATTPSSGSSSVSGTATGSSIATQYGPVQVRVTVKAGKITNVEALALTGDDPKSAEISAQAAPSLLQSALTKQTAAVDAVSGATVTSAGYEASLQSALDKVGFKAADGSRGSSTIPQVEGHGGPGGGGPPGFGGN